MKRFTDEDVDKAARLLSKGGKMLAKHCDQCGAPLFELKGQEICPICSEKEEEQMIGDEPKESTMGSEIIDSTEDIRASMIAVLSRLTRDAAKETDLHRLQMQLDCIERAQRIIRKD